MTSTNFMGSLISDVTAVIARCLTRVSLKKAKASRKTIQTTGTNTTRPSLISTAIANRDTPKLEHPTSCSSVSVARTGSTIITCCRQFSVRRSVMNIFSFAEPVFQRSMPQYYPTASLWRKAVDSCSKSTTE